MLLLAGVVAASAAAIEGVVVDAATGNPIADVNVKLDAAAVPLVSTGLGGRFTFSGLSEGKSYPVAFSRLGYHTLILNLTAAEGLTKVELTSANVQLGEVVITAGRSVASETPGAISNVSHQALAENNSVMEPPLLAPLIPNAVSFNWGGGTLGPMHLRIRGFDMDKQSATINGIPLTDPEDHTTYWQDTPDLLTNVHDVQVTRGVSSSTAGPPGLAGGINLVTSDAVATRETALTYLIGDYNTERRTLLYRSGLIDGRYNITGRFSRVASDGYRDHSGAVEWSYFLAAARYDPNRIISFETWGGEEETKMNFTAVPKAILDTNRTYNPEANYDLMINGQKYDGEKDHFQQPHYIFRLKQRITPGIEYEEALYHIRGTGYYEQYKRGRDYWDYNLTPFYRYTFTGGVVDSTLVDETDLVRRKAVDKYEYGWLPKLTIDLGGGDQIQTGLELRQYKSEHYGRIVWARELPDNIGPDHEYNRWRNRKLFLGGWASFRHHITDELTGTAGLGLRQIYYRVKQDRIGAFPGYDYDTDWTFFQPRLGLTWAPNERTSFYGSIAMSGLEPMDDQMFDPDNPYAIPKFPEFGRSEVKPQKITDVELGTRYNIGSVELGANFYAMLFTDEIIYTGAYDASTDEMVRTNAPTSTHVGLELTGRWATPLEGLSLSGDLSLDRSTFGDFTYHYSDSVDSNWDYIEETVNVKGNQIPLTPTYVANLRMRYERGRFNGTVNWQGVSRQYLDPREDDRWSLEPYATMGASLGYSLPIHSFILEFSLNGLNLLDEEYEPYGWTEPVDPTDYNMGAPPIRGVYLPMFIPAAGRTIMGGATLKF